MKKLKKITALFLVCIISLSLVACNKTASTDATNTQENTASVKTLKIGMCDALTGGASPYGVPQQRAAQMACDQLNASGGLNIKGEQYNVELVSYDNESNPDVALSNVKKLLDQNGVKFIIGFGSGAAAASVCKMFGTEDGVLMLGNARAQDLTLYGDNVFHICRPNNYQCFDHVNICVNELGAKRFAYMGMFNDTSYESLHQSFIKIVEEKGLSNVRSESFSAGDRDLYTQAANIVAQKPDVVVILSYVEEAIFSVKQLRELGYDGPIMTSAGGNADEWLEVLTTDQIHDIYLTIPLQVLDNECCGEKGAQFINEYMEKWGDFPSPTAVHGWEMFWSMIEAINQAQTVDDSEAVCNALLNMNSFPHEILSYYDNGGKLFDPYGQAYESIGLWKWSVDESNWLFVRKMQDDTSITTPISELAASMGVSPRY